MSRTAEYGARSRGQFFNYLPEDITIVGDEVFAERMQAMFGKRGPKVLIDPTHPLYDPRIHKMFEGVRPEELGDIAATILKEEEVGDDGWSRLKGLAREILADGVEVDIAVNKGVTVKGVPQVLDVYGRRRIVATAMAIQVQISRGVKDPEEWIHLPAKIRRGTLEELRMTMIAENDNREGNAPSTQAENVYRAVVKQGHPIQRVANKMNKPVIYLERLLNLRECEPAVIRAVDAGTIPLAAVDQIRKLPPERQVAQAERMVVDPKSPRSAAAQVREENPDHAAPAGATPPEAAPAPKPPPCRKRKALEEERDAIKAKLADPKNDAFRRVNEAALSAILWVLAETDERPSERKGRGAPSQASGAAA